MSPSVSVALAAFNGANYIEAQLRSILEQDRVPDEIVVSDGGSRDTTVDIATRVLAERPDIASRVITGGERLGVTANFARAVTATSGEMIALSDQDDLWRPGRLKAAVSALDRGALLAHSDARLVDGAGAELGVTLFRALGVSIPDLERLAGGNAFDLLIRRNLVTGATTMIHRSLLESALPFPESWVHDEWLAIVASATGRIVPIREQLIDYRQHGANTIGVTAPTLRHRIDRMLQPRGDRYGRLAGRAADLVRRLDAIDAPERWRSLAARKRDFEQRRSCYSRSRVARLAPVIAGAARGDYRALSSQGDLDVLRDLLQPA